LKRIHAATHPAALLEKEKTPGPAAAETDEGRKDEDDE
jgi:hypothetical protein